MKTRLITIAAALAIAGCASTGTTVQQDALAQFHKGTTTEAQVRKALGPPQARSVLSDGETQLVYSGSHVRVNAATFIPVVGLLAGGATGSQTVAAFSFDANGILTGIASSAGSQDVRTGIVNGAQ